MSVIGHWDCSTITISYATYDPDKGIFIPGETTTSSNCIYVIDSIVYYDEGGGGGGTGNGGGDDTEPGGPGIITPPSQPNDYDKNNDGVIDCYKNVIMRINGLFISSDCDAIRQREDGSTYPHMSWDITGPGVDGAIIYAAASGKVIGTGKQTKIDKITGEEVIAGWGYYVMIRDNAGNIWIYAHLKGTDADPSGIGLKNGTMVTAGITPIGLCDSTGNSDGPHLHIEIWRNGVYGDKICPDNFIGKC